MKYMGSKNRIAKYLLPIILKDRKEGQWYVEPFVGGANMIDKVDGNRIGNDSNEYLIAMFQALQNGWLPPEHITKEQYYAIKNDKDSDKVMTFWAGIGCSYCGKWFGGYANDYPENRRNTNGVLPNFQKEVRNGVIRQIEAIKEVDFRCDSYADMFIPKNSIIYCDPPYAGTTSYKDGFDHIKFWQWVREKVIEGHRVFVSEYNSPDDFVCLKEVSTNTQLGNGSQSGNIVKIEKLFCHESQYQTL